MMKVSIAIQHHPARAALLPALLDRLPAGTAVVEDPDPDAPRRSPFRTYLRALSTIPPDATHRLIVQDDALPCDSFEERMVALVTERPDTLMPLFVPGAAQHRRQMLLASMSGERWARLSNGWVPTVALVWPVALAASFLVFVEERGYDPAKQGADDGVVGTFASRRRLTIYAPVPSIVEHPDVEPSLIGRRHRAGENRARVAAIFEA